MLSSFKSKIGNVYCPVYILELLTSVDTAVKLFFFVQNLGFNDHKNFTLIKLKSLEYADLDLSQSF